MNYFNIYNPYIDIKTKIYSQSVYIVILEKSKLSPPINFKDTSMHLSIKQICRCFVWYRRLWSTE